MTLIRPGNYMLGLSWLPKACNFIKKESLAQVFSFEFREISKNTFHRTPPVAASGFREGRSHKLIKVIKWSISTLFFHRQVCHRLFQLDQSSEQALFFIFIFNCLSLILSHCRPMLPSRRNHSANMQYKSMVWLLSEKSDLGYMM